MLKSDVVPAGEGTYLVTGRTGDFGPDVQTERTKDLQRLIVVALTFDVHCGALGNAERIGLLEQRTGRLYFKCVKE